jgi:hypothetical protein
MKRSRQLPDVPLILACVALFTAATLSGQTSTTTIQGDVRDSSGAVIPGAKVILANTATGGHTDTVTNHLGHYLIPYLLPGDYSISAEHAGFERFQQTGIKLDVQQSLELNISMTVGNTSSVVQVTATPQPLATTQSVVGFTTENRAVNDLPLNGRVGLQLSMFVPGVVPSEGTAGSSIGVANGTPYPHSFTPWISGSRQATSEVLMDGVPLGLPNTNLGTMAMGVSGPTVDATQEFTVLTNALPAEYGRTGGGVINTASKQGVNRWHGSAFEFFRNRDLNANYFFANLAGVARTSYVRNDFGGTIGGPVEIPGVYDGRNRTFFFFDLEGVDAHVPDIFTTTVPLDSWKSGDFSALKSASGSPVAIYDPVTVQLQSNGSYVRNPFPGNIIPVSRMDKVGRNLMQYFPEPNAPPTNVNTQANNWTRAGTDAAKTLDFGTRVDHNFTEKWRTFVRVTHGHNNTVPQNFFDNPGTPLGRGDQTFARNAVAWDHTYVLNATTILDVRYGMARMNLHIEPLSYGFKPSELGMPTYLDAIAAQNDIRFPRFDITGLTSLGQANSAGIAFVPTTHNVLADVTKILSRHTIKTGFEYRKLFLNFWQENIPAGDFSFTTLWTQLGPNTATGGNALASMLVGLPGSATQGDTIFVSTASSYYAGYIQDEFRATASLTFNIGLRYEVDTPRTERHNQLSWFNAYAPSPLGGMVPGFPNLLGAMQFATPSSRQQGPTDWNNLGPRFGFAYKINNKTSFRGAYTILYSPSLLQAGYKGNEGLATTTGMTVSTDGRTPLNYLSNPYPYGFNAALGATPGPNSGGNTDVGLTVGNSWFPANDSPMIQQWNATLQRELPGGFLAEAGYVANKGNHLANGDNINYSQLPDADLALGNKLNTLVPNPFYGIITNPNSTLSQPTVSYKQLLSPYPQYAAVTLSGSTYGNSIYHSLILRAERRFSGSVGIRMAYTFGKLIDDCDFGGTLAANGASTLQDAYHHALERAVSSQDISSRLVVSLNAELPFGHGKALLGSAPRLLNAIVGGWQANAIVTLQTGLPIPITQSLNQTNLNTTAQRPNNNGQSAALSGRSTQQQVAEWFNVTDFSIAPAYTFGDAPRTLPDVREPGKRNVDFSLFKNFNVTERLRAILRAEAFNGFNTPQFGYANAQIGNTAVGTISSTNVDPRAIQLALKLQF